MMWMKNVAVALALVALVGAVARAEEEEDEKEVQWKSFTSAAGRFTAKFPGEVKVEEKPNAVHTHASPQGVDADFRIAYTDRAMGDANLEAAFKEIRRIRKKTCEAQGIEPVNELDFLAGDLPACQFEFTKEIGETKAFYRMRFILAGKRFYQVLYGYPTDKPMKAEGELFYKSFKITKGDDDAGEDAAPAR